MPLQNKQNCVLGSIQKKTSSEMPKGQCEFLIGSKHIKLVLEVGSPGGRRQRACKAAEVR